MSQIILDWLDAVRFLMREGKITQFLKTASPKNRKDICVVHSFGSKFVKRYGTIEDVHSLWLVWKDEDGAIKYMPVENELTSRDPTADRIRRRIELRSVSVQQLNNCIRVDCSYRIVSRRRGSKESDSYHDTSEYLYIPLT